VNDSSAIGGYVVGLLIAAAIAVWVANDAKKRGMNGILWGIGVVLLCIVVLPIYLLTRKPLLSQPQPQSYPPAPPQPEASQSHGNRPGPAATPPSAPPETPRSTPPPGPATRAIFVSYRRDDAEGEAGRLFDDLVAVFGENSVFMDVAAIEVGRDFRKVIDQSVASCGVLLAIMGKDWVDAKDETGRRRLDNPLDFVRLETASALKRDIPVIPVLVQGAKMPRAEQLPEDLKELVFRNGVELTGPRWRSDVQLLINALRPHVQRRGQD